MKSFKLFYVRNSSPINLKYSQIHSPWLSNDKWIKSKLLTSEDRICFMKAAKRRPWIHLRPNPLGYSFISKSSWRSYHEKFPIFFASWASSDPLLLSKWPSGVPGQSKRQAIDQERIFSTISFGSDKNRSQVLPIWYELRVLDTVRELDSALLENQLLLERIQSNHHCLFTANVLDFKAVLKYIHNLNYANPPTLLMD